MISAVGIKRILFADIDKVTADITPEIAKTLIQAAIKAKDEVLNVHGETRQIEETEASAIAVKGLVQEPGIEGVSSEYNYEEGQIKALQA